MRITTIVFLAAAIMMVAAPALADEQARRDRQNVLPAFPEAEGFGAVATGGRGGRVIKVTNLNTRGPGSFQAACRQYDHSIGKDHD